MTTCRADPSTLLPMGSMTTQRVKSEPVVQWHPASAADDVLAQWRILEARVSLPLSASADWTRAWLSVYGRTIPHRFMTASVGGQSVAACLITDGVDIRDGPLPVRSIHLGTAGEPNGDSACVEYNAIAVDPTYRLVVLDRLISSLLGEAGYDEIRLDGFAPHELPELRNDDWTITRKASPYFDFEGPRKNGVVDLVACLGRSTRSSLRQNLRAYKDIKVDWSSTVDQATEYFESMVALHQDRWTSQGQPGAYASDLFRRFGQAQMTLLVPKEKAAIVRISSQGKDLGYVHVLIDGKRVLKYQSGARRYESSQQSPGRVADFMTIDASYRRGFDAFDFLAGDSLAKRQLSTHEHPLIWARFRHKRLKYFVLDGLRWMRGTLHSEGR